MRPGLSGSCSVIVTVEAPHLLVDLRVATLEEADRQALVDRVEAVGGSIDVTSSAGRTHVRVRIPVDAAEAATPGHRPERAASHSWTSRSGPKAALGT
jgi:hypothetical protein